MSCAGLDVGSRTIVLVVFGNAIERSVILDNGPNPLRRCQELLASVSYERVVVTGYGRHLVAPVVEGEAVSEIRAYALGARHLYPDCRTVIDIGGQDSKVILLSDNGDVQKFEMNDRCAAGTGRFLEMAANTLETPLDHLADLAMSATRRVQLNSLCAVFAESEIISLISRGEESSAIALGLHETITTRVAGMVRRVGPQERVVFAGGAALNRCLRESLSSKLGVEVTVPSAPQIMGALGTALLAKRNTKHSQSRS